MNLQFGLRDKAFTLKVHIKERANWSCWPILFVVLCLIAGESVAQTSLKIDTSLGFSNTTRLGRWTPLTITVENTGNLFKGFVEVEVTAGDELNGTVFDYTWQRKFELTRGARKRFQFTIYIDNVANPVQVRMVSEGNVVAQQLVDLRQHFTDARIAVVLSRNADLDYLNESSSGRIRVTYPHPDMLPEQWQGYDGVAVVILHSVTLDHWRENQYQALKKWLNQGGRLIVSGGPDYSALHSARLAELLPVTPTGLITVDENAGLRAVLGESFVAPRPFQIHRIGENRGRVTLSAVQFPLAVDYDYGLGQVSYLLFDIGAYPFADWSGMAKLWRDNLDWTETEPERALPTLESSVTPEIFKHLHRRFPARIIVLGFFVAYIATLWALYLTASRGKRAVQLAIWIVPLTCVPVSYLLFVSFLSPAGVSAAVVSVIEPIGSGPYARRKLDIGMISNRPELSTLQVESTTAVLLPRVDEDKPDRVAHWVQHFARPRLLEVVGQPSNILHTLWGEDIVDLSINVAVHQTETGLRAAIRNLSQMQLQFAWLVFDGWMYPVGALSNSLDTPVKVDGSAVVAVNNFSALTELMKGGGEQQLIATQTALVHSVGDLRKNTPLQANEALFIAVVKSRAPVVRSDTSLQVTEVNLLLSRVNVELLPDNSTNHSTDNVIENDAVRPHAR